MFDPSGENGERRIVVNPIRELLKAADIVYGPGGARRVTHEVLLRLAEVDGGSDG